MRPNDDGNFLSPHKDTVHDQGKKEAKQKWVHAKKITKGQNRV